MKKFLLYMTILLGSIQVWSQTVTINEFGAWLETAFVKWEPINDAERYNVYYTGEGVTDQKIDDELIRSYGSYFRADILGLKAGTYTINIKPVISGIEGDATTTDVITVLPHDRTGFAFSNNRVPGAYKADGTPKDGAVILYITENTKNTVSLVVDSANSNPCIGLQTILEGFKKGKDERPLIVRLVGQITDLAYMDKGDVVIENKNNASSYITLEGVGDDAVADGWGIRLKGATNIEIRNIGTMNCNSNEGDNIGLQSNNQYVWVHHVDFFYGDAGGDSDQAKGDGALDSKKSGFVTFSYNHFWDTGKSNLLGNGTESPELLTYHHNWYDHSDSRHPRVRNHTVHVYNNYYDGVAKYGVGSTKGSSVFVEANYYRNCKFPMLTSMQGSDVYDASKGKNDYTNNPTFSKEDGGTIKAFNNFMVGEARFAPYDNSNYPNSTVDFDAYVVSNRNDEVPSSVTSAYGSNTYNNFDTNASIMYAYTPDSPEDAKGKVMQYAGRMNGGDFKWTFNNEVDDTSYNVNTPLKAALTTYTTKLVYIQGETQPSSQILIVTTSNSSQRVFENTAIQNIVFTWSGDATDATISGFPASGIDFIKNISAKTITISGIPTSDVNYSVTTVGSVGTPTTVSGSISISDEPIADDMIHNFTISKKENNFYGITGNMNSKGETTTYNSLSLTESLKLESTTIITFETNKKSTLTLVLSTGSSKKTKINDVNHKAVNGVIIVELLPGEHTIKKGDTDLLFYIKTEYIDESLSIKAPNKLVKLKLHPNPINDIFHINTQAKIENIKVYNMMGALVKNIKGDTKFVDITNLSTGSYLLNVHTVEGVHKQIIIKK